jgi:hypothetical protein
VLGEHSIAQRLEAAARRLEDEQRLGVLVHLPLPAVDRADRGDDVPARGEPFLHEGARDLRGLLGGRRGDEDDEGVLHGDSSELRPQTSGFRPSMRRPEA